MNIKVEGLFELNRAIAKVSKETKNNVRIALVQVTSDLKDYATTLVPVDTGALRDSVYSRIDVNHGDQFSAEVGFKKEYATEQHENLNYNHEQGQAKYLEQPFNENKNKYLEIIENSLKKSMG